MPSYTAVTPSYTVSGYTVTVSTTADTSATIQQVVDRLVGQQEIADRLAVKRVTVERWRQRHGDFPRPLATFSGTPVWWWPNVKTWWSNRAANRGAALAEADVVATSQPPEPFIAPNSPLSKQTPPRVPSDVQPIGKGAKR